MFRANIIYEGMVQGVGFRYTVKRFADELPQLTGWVKNLSDGSVEVFAEGEKQQIEALCRNIEAYFETNITNIKKDIHEIPREYDGFQIRF